MDNKGATVSVPWMLINGKKGSFISNVVAIFNLVHDVEAIFNLHPLIFQKRFPDAVIS